jgi:ADP-heptose:LPS heptosyltransferase
LKIVVLHAGGLGDLVLLETFLAATRANSGTIQIALVCRADIAPISWLYAIRPSEVRTFTFNPYTWPSLDAVDLEEVRSLAAWCSGYQADAFVSAELRGTALTAVLAAASGSPRISISDAQAYVDPLGSQLTKALGYAVTASPEPFLPVAGEHELDRYARLAGVPERGRPVLRRWDAPGPPILAVFPIGAPTIKQLPHNVLIDSATRSARALGVPIALIGSILERDRLTEIAAQFPEPPEIIIGAPEDLSTVSQRIAGARAFLGIDTGLAHLAAAYGIPGAVAYGGGTWPAYAPWANGTVGVVAPIPCFGCYWDCAFGHGFCIEGINADALVHAVASLDANSPPAIVALKPYSEREENIFARSVATLRLVREDRDERSRAAVERLGELGRNQEERSLLEARMMTLEQACAERAELIERLHREIATRNAELAMLRADLASWPDVESRISGLERTCEERGELIERLNNEIQTRDAELAMLRADVASWPDVESRISGLERTCEERGELIERLNTEIQTRDAELAMLRLDLASWPAVEARLAALEQACTERGALIERLSGEAEHLRAIATERAEELERVSEEARRRAVLLERVTDALEEVTGEPG